MGLVSGVVKLFLCATLGSEPRTDKAHCYTLEEFRASLKYVRIMLIKRKHELEMTAGLFVIGLQWFCCRPACL